jgi:hypothetical protein
MPLNWNISHAEHLVTLTATGAISYNEVAAYLSAVSEGGALRYRKLFDAREGRNDLNSSQLIAYAGSVSGYSEMASLGPYAVVVGDDRGRGMAPLLRALFLAERYRPIRLFYRVDKAFDWLHRQPLSVTERTGATREGEGAPTLDEAVLYRGHAEIVRDGAPVNICVKRVGRIWEFLCCRADRKLLGTLAILSPDEVISFHARGQDPLKTTLKRIKHEVYAGRLAVPDNPTGAG